MINQQQKQRLERLTQIEKAIHISPDKVIGQSYDDRLLLVLEAVIFHVGVLQETHNALAHSVRIKENTEKKPTSNLILPGR